ncbi:MAG: type VII secretion protein EccCa [Micromonosporaceae bacterium]|nr:type VII secretion protein EccCa [Micromonosporaceae bacterium]
MIADPPKPQAAPPAAMSAPMIIMPVMAGGGGLMMAITNRNALAAAAGGLFLVAAVAVGVVMLIGQRSGPRRQLRESRERYLDYLEDLRRTLRQTVTTQKRSAAWRHPEPAQLIDLARTPARRWERRVGDEDFLTVRVGVGERPIATRVSLSADDGPLNEFDPVCLETAKTLRDRYATVNEQPISLDLTRLGVLSVVGDRAAGRALARALLAQLVTFHAPQEVRVAVVRADQQAGQWEWAKWLPHHQHASQTDGELPARLVATSVTALAELLRPDLEARLEAYQRRRGQGRDREHLVVVVDGEQLSGVWGLEPPEPGISLADLGIHLVLLLGHRREEPELVDARVTVADNGLVRQEWDEAEYRVDQVPDGVLAGLARLLAPLRMVDEEAAGPDVLAGTVGLPEILGVPDVATVAAEQTWRPRPLRERLRVPIGVGTAGTAVLLDLKESAHGGMGPHGLVVGATGSGKSEMLRTLLTSLVIGHPPDLLALMLVDFKGGATFAPMDGLPHLAGMVTNIEDDISLVDRMHDALFGEMRRRQELLKASGNLPNVSAYQQLRDSGTPLEPLPHLLVVIDEFSELLTAKPDFAELFVAIGRIGRSIGVHLLLATQRLEMGKIRGLESHLSYRISLRTFSEGESREAIGVPDAYHLPPEPGSGYLKVDTTVFEKFKAALVSAPYRPPAAETRTVVPVVPYLSANGLGQWLASRAASQPVGGPVPDGNGAAPARRSILDVTVQRLIASGAPAARPVWLAPLPEVLPLDLVQDPQARGGAESMSATIGLVDDPSGQRQFPLDWDFTGAGGNLLVTGAPQSGKSTLLRTMICSLALRYAPGEVALYCIDYGGGGLVPLAELPVVAGVATRLDRERVGRTVSEVANALNRREQLFREHGLESPAALRAARAAGTVPADVPGAVFLVVDGWATFREDFELLEDRIGEIAARGANYGVYVVLSITQNMQIRMRMQPSFNGRIELRLGDAFDSAFDRALQKRISKDTAGRGVVEGDLMFQAAVPRIDGQASYQDLTPAQQELVTTVTRRWPRGRVPPVQVLPRSYPHHQLPPVDPASAGFPVGISDRDLQPAGIDLAGGDPHLLVYGDGETGKTNLLRVVLHGFCQRYRPEQLGIVLVDYRRSLLGVVPDDYLLAYGAGPEQTAAVAREVAGSVAQRRPGPDVTPAQLRDRSWWKGLEVLVVVDDYDLVSTGSGNPLLPLAELLVQARDLGLHLVLARRTGGAARASLDPLVQRLGDVSTPGFLFSGDRMEGPLANGVASQRLPAGRALYAMRGGGFQQVQVGWLPPPGEPA